MTALIAPGAYRLRLNDMRQRVTRAGHEVLEASFEVLHSSVAFAGHTFDIPFIFPMKEYVDQETGARYWDYSPGAKFAFARLKALYQALIAGVTNPPDRWAGLDGEHLIEDVRSARAHGHVVDVDVTIATTKGRPPRPAGRRFGHLIDVDISATVRPPPSINLFAWRPVPHEIPEVTS
jgi:hypothetical protein